ncbi:MAG: ATP synthase F0 subunit B [Candidatus Aminicenantes bacterium]|nr:ATP synthase F0 subunit B [Candidatus Aminicenantes bacterium]
MLEIDATVIVTFALVWILVFVLNRVFFKPLRKVMDEREKRLQDDMTAAQSNLDESARRLRDVEAGLKAARLEAEETRGRIELAALKEKNRMITENRRKADEPVMSVKRALAVLLLVPFLVFASVDEKTAESRESGGSGFIWQVINFVILFGAMIFFLRKPVTAMLTKKTEMIRDLLDVARRERLTAEAKLAEARIQAAALENEAARLKARAAADGLAETEKIKELAAKEAERIRTLAAQEVAVRLQAGIRELKEYTAELAADIAETRMKSRLTGADQVELIDRSIERMKSIHEESAAR